MYEIQKRTFQTKTEMLTAIFNERTMTIMEEYDER